MAGAVCPVEFGTVEAPGLDPVVADTGFLATAFFFGAGFFAVAEFAATTASLGGALAAAANCSCWGLDLDFRLIQFLLRGRSPLLQRFSQIAPDGAEHLRLLSQRLIVIVGSESVSRFGQRIHNVAESIHVAVGA